MAEDALAPNSEGIEHFGDDLDAVRVNKLLEPDHRLVLHALHVD